VRGRRNKKFVFVCLTAVIAVFLCVVAAEGTVFLYVLLGGKDVVISSTNRMYFDRPPLHYDKVRGYRWNPGTIRVARISGGVVSYDAKIAINQQGWISTKDYRPKRSGDGRRYVVFGDSYTGSIEFSPPWPDLAEASIRKNRPSAGNIELLSFSQPAFGMANWHSIFFGEVLPNYEFDGVIFAIWADDFVREYSASTTVTGRLIGGDKVYMGRRMPIKPKDEADFQENFLPGIFSYPERTGFITFGHVVDEARIESAIRDAVNGRFWKYDVLEFPGIKMAIRYVYRNIISRRPTQIDKARRAYDSAEQNASLDDRLEATGIGKPNIQRLMQVLEYCREHKIEVVMAALPDRHEVRKMMKTGAIQPTAIAPKLVAEHFGLRFFDGAQAFLDLDYDRVPDYFLVNDQHWNSKGASKFAEAFATFLVSEKITGP